MISFGNIAGQGVRAASLRAGEPLTSASVSQSTESGAPQETFAASEARPEPLHLNWKGKSVGAHLLEDPHHLEYASTKEKIRVYGRSDEGKVAVVDFQRLMPAEKDTQSSFTFTVDDQQVYENAKTSETVRGQRLAQGEPSTLGRILPKDHSLRIDRMEISVGMQPESDTYFEQLSDIGSIEGFHMVGIASPGQASTVEKKMAAKAGHNFTLNETYYNEVWLEDYGEPTAAGGRLVPAIIDMSLLGADFVGSAQRNGRASRLQASGLSTEFPFQGAVNESYLQYVAMSQSIVGQGRRSDHGLSYLEGGNILPGTRADGTPYLVVGADSYAITEQLLATQTGRPPTREGVIKAIASDTGVLPSQVSVIEQPGDFHIDMRMMPIGPGELIVQDSRMAAAQQVAWLKEEGSLTPQAQQKLEDWCQKVAPYEDLTSEQLEQAGFKVHRVAGAFLDVNAEAHQDSVNFFNGRHGTDNEGQRFSILMGAPPKAEAYFAKLLLEKLEAPIDRLYFTDPDVTPKTLELQGGLKCRTKSLGSLLEPASTPVAKGDAPSTLVQFDLF